MFLRLVLMAVCAIAAIGIATSAAAAERQCQTFPCRDILYYADATQERVVGVHSTCPGRKGLRGRSTVWKETIQETYEVCTGASSAIPKDFLERRSTSQRKQ